MKRLTIIALIVLGTTINSAQAPIPTGTITQTQHINSPTSSVKKKNMSKSSIRPDSPVQQRSTNKATKAQNSSALKNLEKESSDLPPEEVVLRQRTLALVKKGIAFFYNNALEKSCQAFTHDEVFSHGEISLFLLDMQGNFLASGDEPANVLWKNIKDTSDEQSVTIEDLIEDIKNDDGWFLYPCRNAARVVYVEQVQKNGITYLLGGGYYSFSPAEDAVNLVKQAVNTFEQKRQLGRPVEDAFSDMSYPLGRFARGEFYLVAYDFDGNIMAHGDDPTAVGSNQLDFQDKNGVYYHKEIIQKLKNSGSGIWQNYLHKRELKRTYAEKVKDANGKEYAITSGYYPEADRKALVDLVERGYEYMKTVGKTQAANAFTTRENDDFRRGNLYLFVYDREGNNIAHGKNPTFVGKNYYNTKDDHGNYVVRELLENATLNGTWINLPRRNSIESIYVKTIDLGIEKFVIGAGIYPTSREDSMILLTKSAANFIMNNDDAFAFLSLSQPEGAFIRGDIEIFVFDPQGFCLVYGDNPHAIWQNFITTKDDSGSPFVKTIINSALNGPTEVRYRVGGFVKKAYAESIKKGGKTYIVGSSTFVS